MTALEEQLTRALRRLSAQFETAQRRQSGQVEALRRRVGNSRAGPELSEAGFQALPTPTSIRSPR